MKADNSRLYPRLELSDRQYSFEPKTDIERLWVEEEKTTYSNAIFISAGSGLRLGSNNDGWHYTPFVNGLMLVKDLELSSENRLLVKYDLTISTIRLMRESSRYSTKIFRNCTNKTMAVYLRENHYASIFEHEALNTWVVRIDLGIEGLEKHLFARALYLSNKIILPQ